MTPKITHESLMRGDGTPLTFIRMTDEPCPECGKGPTPVKLGVITEDPGKQETVHCIRCHYNITRRPAPTRTRPPPMNSR